MIKFNMAVLLLINLAISGCASVPRRGAMDINYGRTADAGRISAEAGRLNWPLKGEVILGFGDDRGGIKNKGLDILAKPGEGVRAAGDGRVVFIGQGIKGLGKTLIIEHDGDYQTVYGNNSEVLVKEGEIVRRGDLVAKAGYSGRLERPALHFEVRRRSRPVNPIDHLSS